MPDPLVYQIYRTFWVGLDWLFPPICAGCGKHGQRWCDDCQRSALVIAGKICPCCGIPQESSALCFDCSTDPPRYHALRSWAVYRGAVRNAVLQLKFKRNIPLGDRLASLMIACLEKEKWAIDLIVPVPMDLAHLARRGYNQAALLARPLALASGLVYQPSALKKVREIRTQVGLSARKRRENVRGAFSAEPALVKGKSIMLVDDVITTGSILRACADALHSAGACDVYGVSFARASIVQANAQV
jgi:competence protein ComFC